MHKARSSGNAPRQRSQVGFAASKFIAPSLATWHVSRARLRDRLDAADDHLRLVIGPPGAGKTALLAEWFHSRAETQMCWLHADGGDYSPLRFWSALVQSVRTKVPTFSEACLDMLRLNAEVDHEWLECFLAAAEVLKSPTTVIIDDFHCVGPETEEQLRFVLERGVQPLQLAVGTRVEPNLGVHRMRLAAQLCEIRESDLLLERTEASDLCKALDAHVEHDDALDAIMARTDGWAAGVQLAAIALRHAPQPAEFVRDLAGTSQVIFQYLWSEVFAAQSVEVQRFLIDTCVVDELEPSLAAALSPYTSVTLRDVQRLGLMLRQVDDADQTFRFHHLLTEMLRLRLRSDDPEHEATLHERAAVWYERRGRLVDAFRHRWRGGHRAEALQSMHRTVLDLVYDDLTSMSEAERSLSDDDIRRLPGPALSFAAALMINGLVADAFRLTKRVQATAASGLEAADRELLTSVMMNALLVVGDVDAILQLERRLPWRSPVLGPWTVLARCATTRAHVWQSQFDDAAQCLDGLLPHDATALHRMEAAGTAAQLQLFRGDLHDCARTLDDLFQELDREGSNELRDGLLARAIRGNLLLERADTRAAEEHLRSVSDTRSRLRVPAVVLADIGLSRLWAVEGQLDAASVAVDLAYRQVKTRSPRSGVLDHIRRQHARTLLFAGADDDAASVVRAIEVDRHSRLLLTIEVELARGHLDQAEKELSQLEATAPTTTRHRLDVALARLALDLAMDRNVAEQSGAVLDLVESDGQVFPLVETNAATLAEVQHEARRRPRSAVVDTILRLPARTLPGTPRGGPAAGALTEREHTVLRYLASTLSYTEIAGELYVSRNTIKTHVKNIKQKLHTESRQATLRRARELGYL